MLTSDVRVVATSLPSYTKNAGDFIPNAMLTASANGALTIDGVAVAAGDTILVNLIGGSVDNGPYTVAQPGSATTPFMLSRGFRVDTGGARSGFRYHVAAGTVWANSTWLLVTPDPITIGTTSIQFFPQFSSGTGTLSSGAVTIANLWILAAATNVTITPNGAFSSSGQVRPSTITAGAGNGSIAVSSSSGSDATPIKVVATNF
jgi:hypothetical protein